MDEADRTDPHVTTSNIRAAKEHLNKVKKTTSGNDGSEDTSATQTLVCMRSYGFQALAYQLWLPYLSFEVLLCLPGLGHLNPDTDTEFSRLLGIATHQQSPLLESIPKSPQKYPTSLNLTVRFLHFDCK